MIQLRNSKFRAEDPRVFFRIAPTPPGPKGLPLVGSLFPFLRDMPNFLLACREQYGELSGFRLPVRDAMLITKPEWIDQILVQDAALFHKSRGLQRIKNTLGEGLLTSEGDFHLRQRRISSRAFARKRVLAYADCMVDFTAARRARFTDGEELDIGEMFAHLTLRIVAKTLFDSDSTQIAERVGHSLTELQRLFPFLLLPGSQFLELLPTPWVLKFRRARAELDDIIFGIISERRQNPEDRGDLLSMLMLASDEQGDGGQMDDRQLRDECLTNFLAGHETTANALTWTLYLLSQNPLAYEELLREVDDVLQGRLPNADDYSKLSYTKMVLQESMRLFPPAWTLGRTPIEVYQLERNFIPPGSIIFLSPYVNQRDPRWFPEPLRFEPRRFDPSVEHNRPKFSYFPFGAGRRKCLGERFAWMESVLVLATLSQDFRFQYQRGRPPKLWASVTLRPDGPVPMIARKR